MAALTDDVQVEEKVGELVDMPVAVDVIYRGALVKTNAAGFLAPCAAEAGGTFAGMAQEKVDNSAGSAGDESCKVGRKNSMLLTGSGFAQANVGDKVYASDDQTITLTHAANLQLVGVIERFVSSTQVWVKADSGQNAGDAAIIDATGGATIDAEARVAVNAILAALREQRIIQG